MRKNPLSNMSAHGGIITSEFLETIRGDNAKNPRVEPQCFATFNMPTAPKDKRELDRQIDSSFKALLERWDAISNRYQKMTVSEARSKWMVPLFKELGFDLGFNKEDIIVDGDDKLRFRLSHRGWISASAPMVHMVAPSQDLEEASDGSEGEVVRRGRTRSPHDEMQAYLNVTKGSKWGIVTNGILLRILREYYHTTTKGYVEFDLENIFRERSFTDFRAMYRMVHASRFLADKDGVSSLEQFYKESVAAGVRVGEGLRQNVKKAIEALGNGFLTPDLTKKMIEDEEFCKAYYAELLRVVYRLLFLLFAEQRAMLPTKDSLYIEEYSITRLREMAETRHGKDDHHDLWEGLKVTFHMLKKGCTPLKVFGYNGSLFDDSEIPTLPELACKNEDVLEAVRNLTLIEEERVLKRINYLDLGVSEIGSIYESLLDYSPKVFANEQEIEGQKIPANAFVLDPRGAARKTSGSYYTNSRLIDELIKSALKPVFEDRVSKTFEKEKALLSIKVCDPACGSGAFLIAANNFLGKELAKLRTNQPEPSDKEVRKATRDVLQHCIYGVDLNPMATELAKVSLWINSCVDDQPLNFLDHHIKCGNSLIGTTFDLLNVGISDDAFVPIEDDDKTFAKELKLQNMFEKKSRLMTEFQVTEQLNEAKAYALLDDFDETSPDDVEEKKNRYYYLLASSNFQTLKTTTDMWTASFFWSLNKTIPPPPTESTFRMLKAKGIQALDKNTKIILQEAVKDFAFFHWKLEFPDIFSRQNSGFDCVIGNPPWEMWQPEEKQFFSESAAWIAELSADARKTAIERLQSTNKALYVRWAKHKRALHASSKFWKYSERFKFGKGRINTFALFSELAEQILSKQGRAGIIVPSAIATDDACKDFFAHLTMRNRLESLFDFENKEGLFPGVLRSYKFSLLTIRGDDGDDPGVFGFFLTDPSQVNDEIRRFDLRVNDFNLLNPNTRTCPIFRTKKDAELTKEIYSRFPVLVNDDLKLNPWQCTIRRIYNMGIREVQAVTIPCSSSDTDMPIWESKLIWKFDHRFATYEGCDERMKSEGYPVQLRADQKVDIFTFSLPRRWMPMQYSTNILTDWYKKHHWLLAFRDITNATNERTIISSILPEGAPDFTLRILFTDKVQVLPLLLGNLNSVVLDYVVRQKIGGMHMSDYVTEQLPIIPPAAYTKEDRSFIFSRVIELVYTSLDLKQFAEEMGFYGKPFAWNEERRALIQAELDACFAQIYGLSREDLCYILDPSEVMGVAFPSETFRVLKENELKQFGEYRTQRLILEAWDKYFKLR